MSHHPYRIGALAGFILLLLMPVAWSTPGYFPGSYYTAHVIRKGGELVPNEEMDSGYRWENYDVVRVRGNRVPASAGHGLEVFADIFGMPAGQPVKLRVMRPVRTADGKTGVRSFTRSLMLYETDTPEVQVFNYFYFLDDPDELVPGTWTIEVSYEGGTILRETFEVYPDPL